VTQGSTPIVVYNQQLQQQQQSGEGFNSASVMRRPQYDAEDAALYGGRTADNNGDLNSRLDTFMKKMKDGSSGRQVPI
jgi:hypothetical protein